MKAWVVCASFAMLTLSGCVENVDTYFDFEPDDQYRNPGVFPGTYSFANGGSSVLTPGHLKAKDPELIELISDLPAFPGGLNEGIVDIRIGLWLPDNYTEEMPLIVDAGPYYEIDAHCEPNPNRCNELVNDTVLDPQQLTPFLLRNFLPHGYAIAQIGVRGTGQSGGCMDLLGPSEQADLNQAINYLASQPWSNGNVAMLGVSYDATTPWMVAASGNPHLKTIVPMSGLPSMFDLMFKDGSPETRGPIMYHQVYWPFGFSDEFPDAAFWDLFDTAGVEAPIGRIGQANDRQQHEDLQNLVCPEVADALAATAVATATGLDGAPATQFWAERDYRQRVLDNYEGSVFLIHGLQDFNVDPHAVIPYNQELRAAGVPLKEWYGQWGHTSPDGNCVKSIEDWAVLPCRLDFADILYRWFETYLNDNPMPTGPEIQVQDNVGFWRNVEAFPASDRFESKYLVGDALTDNAGTDQAITMLPGLNGPMEVYRYRMDPQEDELRISGIPELHFDFETIGEGGFIGAWLMDVNDENLSRAPSIQCITVNTCVAAGIPIVGHGQVNLLHATGEFAPIVPLQRTSGVMEFEPLDVVVPPGNHLELWVFQYQYPDHYGTFTPSPVNFYAGTAELRLPMHDLDPRTVFPAPGAHFLNTTYVPDMYNVKPALPSPVPDAVTLVEGLL